MPQRRKYSEAPWVFEGRAIYQLQLVKLEEAKKYIPEDLQVVSAFGYTLGGFYLAKYDESPVGAFEECVALAGIVWNRPSSCAWAARVYVNNREARDHGRQHVGLPSRVCSFSDIGKKTGQGSSWWDQPLSGTPSSGGPPTSKTGSNEAVANQVVMSNVEPRNKWRPWNRSSQDESADWPLCKFSEFPKGDGKHGPRISLSLPSFSGRTADEPNMLRYACQLSTNARIVKPLRVAFKPEQRHSDQEIKRLEDLKGILGGKPVLALAFDRMKMVVHQPVPLIEKLDKSQWQLEGGSAGPQAITGSQRKYVEAF